MQAEATPESRSPRPLKAAYPPGALERFEFAGAIDADGHIVEPPDLWTRYLEPAYRRRALTIRKDDQGLEYMEIDGKPSKLIRHGTPQALAAMDRIGGIAYQREPTGLLYVDNAPLGAMDARERLQRLDLENIERAFLYPTLGVLWVAECDDEELTQAYLRAYNRWIVDFCSDSNGRLIPIAQLSLGDPAAAEAELRRAAKDGVKGVWVPPFTWTRKPLGHPDHHRVFAAAQELGLPFGIHPSFEPKWAAPGRFGEITSIRYTFFINVTAPDAVRHAFTSLFQFGVFEQFPELRVVILESGAGWIGYWLDRMDGVYEMPQGKTIPLKNPPSYYFKRQCWISADPDESTLPALMPIVGADRFFWASDFPHPDHAPKYAGHMNRIAAQLDPAMRAGLLGHNVLRAYGMVADKR
jgi:predicted TIM-barrel fold metal-dependent hydrolase